MVYVVLNILRNLTLMSRCLVELGPLLAAEHMGILVVRVQAHLKSQSLYDPHIEFCSQNGFRS